MALPPGVRAYLATRLFEWEVGNGGLHQYFFNYPSPDLLTLVLDGYSYLRLPDARRVVEELVAPVAEAEHAWRNSLRDGTIEGFFASYPESCLADPFHVVTAGNRVVDRTRRRVQQATFGHRGRRYDPGGVVSQDIPDRSRDIPDS